jgi:hypothetical protein
MTDQKTILGPSDLSYCDILNLATNEALAGDADVKRNPVRPSGAGGCTREIAYKLMEFTGQKIYGQFPFTAETNRIFASGHALEYDLIKQIRKYMSDICRVKYTQHNLYFEKIEWAKTPALNMELEGSIDLVLWSEQFRAVIDIKTKKDKFSAWHKTQWDEQSEKLRTMETVQPIGTEGTGFYVENLKEFLAELNDPFFEANFLQLNLYATHPDLVQRGIDHAAILQYNKNDSRLREVRFKPCMDTAKDVLNKFKLAIYAADEGDPELAPRDHMLGSIKCAFCDYKKECWPAPTGPETDPLKSYFKTLPKRYWATRLSDLDAKDARHLEALLQDFETSEKKSKEYERAAEKAADYMLNTLGIFKIKDKDGFVFSAREYKSPKPRITLKRSKE